jgi:hypothetical protein
MENMRSRIDRGDIKLERAEAIKVRAHRQVNNRVFKLIHITSRQCVTLQQTGQSNSNNHSFPCTCSISISVVQPWPCP